MTDHTLTMLLQDLTRVVRDIDPGLRKEPTPCTELDVASLERHLLGWLHLFDVALTDPAGERRPDPAAHPAAESPSAAAAEIEKLTATVRTTTAAGVRTAEVNVPPLGGVYPGAVVLDLLTAEVLGHGWDLARATGQVWQPDPAACERALATLHGMVRPEYRGPGMPFGPEVPVAVDAPALDRFLAFTGREPHWAPGH
ncbi:TIGR03086 family metal-binding protein [Jidongwangia harbinensis]|uniref:TIGR03086 family metal-binding protein n=1 Tax=Jidongwangia harbinensis TaxID=2878561 RepID=UPI001CD99DB9|nr:TIGR03086 family metal-binding protein [Jidongwangia harbinensis]MCA2212140.1 TIGR03086 family protein [Jidongwangia harbinensis]